jgi:hypothetical protein
MNLDVHYVQLHSKSNSNVSIKDKTSYNLEQKKYFLFLRLPPKDKIKLSFIYLRKQK